MESDSINKDYSLNPYRAMVRPNADKGISFVNKTQRLIQVIRLPSTYHEVRFEIAAGPHLRSSKDPSVMATLEFEDEITMHFHPVEDLI